MIQQKMQLKKFDSIDPGVFADKPFTVVINFVL
jgi:hypothetical protein